MSEGKKEARGKVKVSDNVQTVEVKRRELANRYRKEKKVPVSISPMYRAYVGNAMAISINGIAVYVPCNGHVYYLPESFALEALTRVKKIDEMLTKKERMTDISSNFETSPGELKFF